MDAQHTNITTTESVTKGDVFIYTQYYTKTALKPSEKWSVLYKKYD